MYYKNSYQITILIQNYEISTVLLISLDNLNHRDSRKKNVNFWHSKIKYLKQIVTFPHFETKIADKLSLENKITG